MSAIIDSNLHNVRGDVQGTVQLYGAIGATSVAQARTLGFTDFGNFMGSELTGEAATTDRLRAVRGKVTRAGYLPGKMGLGYKFKTQELADARKFRFALLGDVAGDLAQTSVATTAVDAIVFSAPAPSVAGRWYPILQGGARRVELTALTIAGKTEGTDFVVDYKLGQVRFLTTQTASVTPTISAPTIDAASALGMVAVTPLARSFWTGYWTVLFWDQDPNQPLVLRHEEFLGDLKVSTWPKIDGDALSELEFEISVNPGDAGKVWHRP